MQAHTCRLYDVLSAYQAVNMCECVCGVGMDARLYLRLRGVVWVVSVVVFTWHGGLYTGGVEEAAQLLLLALSQAVDDATQLLLLLQAHKDVVWSVCDTVVRGDCYTLAISMFSVERLTARMRLRHFFSHMRIVCLATSSSMVYSNCSLANSSSSWRDFLMSTERYDSMLYKTHTRTHTAKKGTYLVSVS